MLASEVLRKLREPGFAYAFVTWTDTDEQLLVVNKAAVAEEIRAAMYRANGDFEMNADLDPKTGELLIG